MKHILVVDDDNMNCILARHALAKNYEVTTVFSAKETMEFLEENTPDLILMDIEMPEMDGKTAAKMIKTHKIWREIPIIFLTSATDPATEVECLELGADDFITKPFVPPVMISRVSRTLELHELRKELQRQLIKKTEQAEQATIKSLTDALTGLNNRVFLETKLAELLSNGCSGALFMMDLDNFKSINDTFGHQAGDKTLQLFAEVMKNNSSDGDLVVRLAGDEFVMFNKGVTNAEKLSSRAQLIIDEFNKAMAEAGYSEIVSVSIGIMVTDGSHDYEELYNKADKSLYYIKNRGKNSYYFYGTK